MITIYYHELFRGDLSYNKKLKLANKINFIFNFLDLKIDKVIIDLVGNFSYRYRGCYIKRCGNSIDYIYLSDLFNFNTMCHEFVHCKQYHDSMHDFKTFYYETFNDYVNDPIEVEARELAEIMVDQYNRYFNNYVSKNRESVEYIRVPYSFITANIG